MASLNQCQFIGRIGKKAEIRDMTTGKRVASFSLAVDQSYKKDGEKVESTEWVNIVVFAEGLIKIIENYTDKGSLLFISGQLQTRSWDVIGTTKYKTEIVLQGYNSTLQLLDSKGMVKPTAEKEKKEEDYRGNEPVNQIEDDDLPF